MPDLKEIEESHRKENGELREQVKELEEDLTSVYLKGIYDERDKWKQQCIHFKEMLDDMDIAYLYDEWIYGELKGDLE